MVSKKTKYFSICFILILWGCAAEHQNIVVDDWENFSQDIAEVEYIFTIDENTKGKLYLYKFSNNDFLLELKYSDPPKWIFQWYRDLGEPSLVVNGFYFHEDLSPSGFFISEGTRIGQLEFDQDKTGLINFDSKLEILDTSQQAIDLNSFSTAAQSYPFLVKNGQASVTEDSGLLARRSFIGLDIYNNVYIGVVPKHKISLYKLSHVLIETGLPWSEVMNLDGGPSTGIAINKNEEMDYFNNFTPVPNVIVVKER
ncbi:phosphodiester glycosidase family protein [Patescibacteria group bacterium]